MSRAPLWCPTVPTGATDGVAGHDHAAAPTGAPVAPGARIHGRSTAAAQLAPHGAHRVALSRLSALLSEAAGILIQLSEVPLADARDSRDMTCVETNATRPRLLTIQDIAERLQLDARTIRRMRARGQLPPAIDLYSVLRWDEATIEAWIEGRRER